MDRVGFVILSIVIATAIVVGASYGALWLTPYLDDVPSPWPWIGFAMLFPAAALLMRHWRNRARA